MNVVTSKGQVTIPKAVRDRLGIEPGNVVDFELGLDGRVVLVKRNGKPPHDRLAERVGFEPTVSLHPRRFSRPLP